MKLRNGKQYVPFCYVCEEHYSNEKSSTCSLCNSLDNPRYSWKTIYYSEEFQNKLKNYAQSLIAPNVYKNLFKKIAKKNNLQHLFQSLKLCFDHGFYLDAEFAYDLLYKTGLGRNNRKIHIICPMIIDWWNITRTNGWHSTEICYYGRHGEPHLEIKKMDPPLPNNPPGGWNWFNLVKCTTLNTF